jgi:tRNA(adenine34) deaminase
MTPEELVALALDVAEEGQRAGELPIGAVVAMGDDIIGRAAMVLGVSDVHYGLEAADDGAAGVPAAWQPIRQTMPFSRLPVMTGGHLRRERADQFRRYAATASTPSLRRYAESMAALPDDLESRSEQA